MDRSRTRPYPVLFKVSDVGGVASSGPLKTTPHIHVTKTYNQRDNPVRVCPSKTS